MKDIFIINVFLQPENVWIHLLQVQTTYRKRFYFNISLISHFYNWIWATSINTRTKYLDFKGKTKKQICRSLNLKISLYTLYSTLQLQMVFLPRLKKQINYYIQYIIFFCDWYLPATSNRMKIVLTEVFFVCLFRDISAILYILAVKDWINKHLVWMFNI